MAKLAFINLSTGEILIRPTPPEDLKQFLGGRGLGAKLLYELVGPEVDPLAPENCLIFSAGPAVGSPWPASSRLHITFKSPLTGAYGSANSGGFFAAELRHAGYDAMVITGRAENPVVLQVFDGDISLRDGSDLWGATTSQTHEILLGREARSGEAGRLACIGPAGENLVRFAGIVNDFARSAARGGPGAVMGSKNLKAVLVQAAEKPTLPPSFDREAELALRKLQTNPNLNSMRRYGTLGQMESRNVVGDQPAKNHQSVQVPFIHKINAAAFDTFLMHRKGCYACPIHCNRVTAVAEGPYAVDLEGPDAEMVNALGSMCWINDPEAIIYASHLCNEYGLDPISAGVTIAFAMELHERGLLNDEELSLEWGDQDTLIGLIEQIVDRRGLGNTLAEGARRAAEVIGHGAGDYAMHVKGLELPRQDPRFAKGFGLAYCTSNCGADDLYALPSLELSGNREAAQKIFPEKMVSDLLDPASERYKPNLIVFNEHFCAVVDALGICKFTSVQEYSLLPSDLAPAATALLGYPLTEQELLFIGERIVNLERLYNVRHGLGRADDTLPARFSREAAPLYEYRFSPQQGELVASDQPIRYGRVDDLETMLDRYYELRGWSQDGRPTREALERLGLLVEAAPRPDNAG